MTKKRKASSPLQPSTSMGGTVTGVSHRQHPPDQQLELVRRQMADLQRRMDELETENDRLQQRFRLPCLIFSGSALPRSGRPAEIPDLIHGIVKDRMGYSLDRNQIKSAFRLRSGNVFVEFTSAGPGSDRDAIYRSKTKLRGSGIFISESLTPRRQMLFRSLLEMKRAKLIISVYTQSGDIFIRRSFDSSPLRVPDMVALQQLTEAESPRPGSAQGRAQAPRPVPGGRDQGTEDSATPDSAQPAGDGSLTVRLDSPPAAHELAPPLHRDAVVTPSTTLGLASAAVTRGNLVTCHTPTVPEPDPDSVCSDLAACQPPVDASPTEVACGEPASCQPPAGPSQDVTARSDLTACQTPRAGQVAAQAGDEPVTGASVATGASRSESVNALCPMERPSARFKMRVSVLGRSRIITVSNQDDVIQTIKDLFEAGKTDPIQNYKDVDSFKLEYNMRVMRLIDTAETEGENVQLAEAARLIQIEAQRLMRELRPGLDRAWRAAHRL